MLYTMTKYYDTLQFLRHLYVDRQYPLAFNESDDTTNLPTNILSDEYTSTHDKSYKFTDVDSVIFKIPLRKYDTSDDFYLNICSSEEFTPADITISFSESSKGQPIIRTLENNSTDKLEPNKIHKIRYIIKDTNTSLNTKSEDMGNIGSISILFKKTFPLIYISDLVFRKQIYNFTLEDLDYYIKSGEDHVKARLKMSTVPSELEFLTYKAGGAYAWLVWWQSENKNMDDMDENSKNYYNRLLADVDNIIDSYLDTNPELSNDNDINMKLVGSVPLFGRKPCLAKGASRRCKR